MTEIIRAECSITPAMELTFLLRDAVVESLSIVVICYHFLLKKFEENDYNYSNACIFPYFTIEQINTSRQ